MEHFLAEISALTETTQPTLMFFPVGIVRNHDSVWWPQLLPSKQISSSKCFFPSPTPFSGRHTSGASFFEHGYLAGTLENLKHTALEPERHGGRPTTSIFGRGI